MKTGIYAIGRIKRGPEAELVDRYLDRAKKAGPALGLTGFELAEFDESRAKSAAERKRDEGEKLLDRAGNAVLVVLDETGKNLKSVDFANWLAAQRDQGTASIAYLLGGPDGHDQTVVRKSNLLLSLGKMTLPHLLARVVLAEQLYRAVTIFGNHPYHRA
ncbi:MAG: 23S rRNA (pseudouridine(1915)-N(3))-methyltransferase RlmH [Pseudomonadota bacterium]